jgi:hypothetical protein
MSARTWSCVLAVWVLGCSSECELADDLRLFAGDAAIDCGSVPPSGDRANVDACVADAFENEDAFVARYEQPGVERRLIVAVARNSEGRVKIFRFDTAPCGSNSCDPVTDVQSCEEPSLSGESHEDPEALPVECESLGLPERVCG